MFDDARNDLLLKIYKKIVLVCFIVSVISICIVVFLYNSLSKIKNEKAVEEEKYIAVDIAGAVKNPGVYSLKEGSIVSDVINEASGILNTVSFDWVLKNLNLSEHLVDSQKIYIPFDYEIAYTNKDYSEDIAVDILDRLVEEQLEDILEEDNKNIDSDNVSDLLNINLASQSELEALPGIGKTYAEKIIANRPYASVEELSEKTKIPQSTLDKFITLITF